MFGVDSFDFPYNFGLTSAIDFSDIIMSRFACDRNGIEPLHMAAYDFSGASGRADSDIHDRLSHGG